jgi:hypothetical protein
MSYGGCVAQMPPDFKGYRHVNRLAAHADRHQNITF